MELIEKVRETNTISILWFFLGLFLFLAGIGRHDWFMFLGGIFILFDGEIDIIHWGGKRYN